MTGIDEWYYNGEPFTGTIVDKSTTPYSFSEYKNGLLNGHSVSYYPNGQIEEDYYYENGEDLVGRRWYKNGQIYIESPSNVCWDKDEISTIFLLQKNNDNFEEKIWHPNGQLMSHSKSNIFWDEDGTVIRKNGLWLFKNGSIRYSRDSNSNTSYYSKSYEIAIKIIHPEDGSFRKTELFHSVLSKSFKELINHEYCSQSFNLEFRSSPFYDVIDWLRQSHAIGYKEEAIKYLIEIINEIKVNLKNNLNSTIHEIEKSRLDFLTSLLERFHNGETDRIYKNAVEVYSKIIFD